MFFCSLGLEGYSCKIGNAPNLTGKKTKSLEEHLDYTRGVGGTHSFVWILPKIVYTNTNKLLYKYKQIVIQIQKNCYTNTTKLLYKYNFFYTNTQKIVIQIQQKIIWYLKNEKYNVQSLFVHLTLTAVNFGPSLH